MQKCCGADRCCHDNKIWARRGDPVAYRVLACSISNQLLVVSDQDRSVLVREEIARRAGAAEAREGDVLASSDC